MLLELEVGAIADGAVCCGSELARLSAPLGYERSDKGGDDNAGGQTGVRPRVRCGAGAALRRETLQFQHEAADATQTEGPAGL